MMDRFDLGAAMDDIYKQLSGQILLASWIDLGIHIENGNVFRIPDEVDIVVIAQAIATDQTRVVEAWLKSGFLCRISDKDAYSKEDLLRILIIQPFVIVQEPPLSKDDST